ncbi:MAG: hypothetical protein Q7S92_03315, partial [Candidatus Diapherotrites archaeon]|nr:hypothetical protein [Candidatus Diapherotrites archaeon]
MEQESKENSNLAKAIERLQFEAHDIAPSLHGRLDKLLKAQGIGEAAVSFRVKSKESIQRKIITRNCRPQELTDIL